MLIVLPFKFAPLHLSTPQLHQHMPRESSWAESGLQFGNDNIPADIGELIFSYINSSPLVRSLLKGLKENFNNTSQT